MTASAHSASPLQPIYYFGYGPIVHPVVRHRRDIPIASVEAAILYEHRLVFNWGGLVTVVPQRGYEVYGVLLQFDTQKEWEAFMVFDEGGYNTETLQVYSLKTERQVTVRAFIMPEYDVTKQEPLQQQQLETLPQERYLKLMADGMKQLGIDPDYIRDQIMSVPYTLKTKPQVFRTFPRLSTKMKRISLSRYRRLCQHAGPTEVYFVIGCKVVRLDDHDPKNPCSKWIRTRFHGLPEMTLLLHKTVVDPDLNMVDEENELTPDHLAWAENHIHEFLEQGGLSATVISEMNKGDVARAMSRTCYCCTSWILRESHHGYQRSQQQRRNSDSTVSSDASSDVALHRISRTRRGRRIRPERSWYMGSRQDSSSSELLLRRSSINATDTTVDESSYNEDEEEEHHHRRHRRDSCGGGGEDDDDEIQVCIPQVIVRHDIFDNAIPQAIPPADDVQDTAS
jgi:hypothetical protein